MYLRFIFKYASGGGGTSSVSGPLPLAADPDPLPSTLDVNAGCPMRVLCAAVGCDGDGSCRGGDGGDDDGDGS